VTFLSYRHQQAFALHDRSTAAKEANDEHENSGGNEQDGSTQHVVGGRQRRVGALRHLQPDTDAEYGTAQQLPPTQTHPATTQVRLG